jgi:phage terminase small subunit
MADLTPRQQRFVEEYLVDLNATRAAERAGYSAATSNEQGARLLAKASITAAVEALQEERARRTGITADKVLMRWWDLATADPNALIQHRRAPCRYCHGINHHFQWKTPREFEEAVNLAAADERPAPSNAGGYGYSVSAEILADCPECNGEGIGYTLAADTRSLSGAARILYAGAKQTRDGLEIKLHDQSKALENVAKHLGMFTERVQHTGTGTDGAVKIEDATPQDTARRVAFLLMAGTQETK